MLSNPSPPANSSSSALTKTGGDRLLAKMFASSCFIPSNSHGYFWDVEEIRHQEHLRRVSHAQHLYRHRHDSTEAAKLYRSFMEEQNEWMDEQERMKEMELRLSVKAYQQRASRWEDEWRRLEEGGDVEEILKPHRKNTLLVTGSSQYGYLSFSGEESSTHGLTDLLVSPKSISSLDLPSPLLSFRGSAHLVNPRHENTIQKVDGAHYAKIQRETKTLSTPRFSDPGVLDLTKTSMKDAYTLARSRELRSVYNSRSESSGSGEDLGKPLSPRSETTYDPKDTPASSRSQIMSPEKPQSPGYCVEGLRPHRYVISPSSSSSNWSRVIPRSELKQEQTQKLLLANGEVLRIITHKFRDNGNLLYLVSWKPQNSGIPPVQCWLRVADFSGGPKKLMLEEYHLRSSLGPIRWPRNPRRHLRSSTSFGVREIKAALGERKQVLVERGADILEVTRELDEERWKMRDDWQRAGRGWGSAIMVVEDRKKAWKIADLEAEHSFVRKTQVSPSPPTTPTTVGSSSYVTMLKAAGIIDATNSRVSPELKAVGSISQREGAAPSPKIPTEPFESPFGDSNSSNPDESVEKFDEKGIRFMSTIEGEREWGKHLGLEPGSTKPTHASTHSAREIKISRVQSTLRSLPNTLNLNHVRAKTLPRLGRRLQVLDYEYQGSTDTTDSTGSLPLIRSSESESQSYLKAQRKSLLSRLLSRRRTKRENRNQGTLYNLDVRTRRSGGPLILAENNIDPLRLSRSSVEASQSNHCALSDQSSYVSFDGAASETKIQTKKSWKEVMWDKFAYFLAPSSHNASSSWRKTSRTPSSRRASEKPRPPKNEKINDPKPRDGAVEDLSERQGAERLLNMDGISLSRPLLVETITRRTASWVANIFPPLRKSKSEEPGRLRSSFEELEYTAPNDDAEEPDINQYTLRAGTGGESASHDAYCSGSSKETGKHKGKSRLLPNKSPRSVRSVTLTITASQETYLTKRQAEMQLRRDKELLRIKSGVKIRKGKDDQRAKDLQRFEELRSKKSLPFGKWGKPDQLELESLAKRLDMGPDGRPIKGVLKNAAVGDIKHLRRGLL